jgi:hypothetical protein
MRLGYVDSAIFQLHTVVMAEKRFAEAHPALGYTCTFSDLSSSEPPVTISGEKARNGYVFELICPVKNGNGVNRFFHITARPLDKDMPVYCGDQSGIVRYDEGGSPTRCLMNGSTP